MTETTICLWYEESSDTPDYLMKTWAPAPGIDDLIKIAMLLAGRNFVQSAMVTFPPGECGYVYTRFRVVLLGQASLDYRVNVPM